MLIEQRLNTQHSNNNNPSRVDERNVKLVIDPKTGEIMDDVDRKPSMAEVLLYMLTGRLSSKYIPGNPIKAKEVQRQFADLIIHNSTKTILKNQKVEDQLQHYAEKQLAIVGDVLKIALPEYSESGVKRYHLATIKIDDLFKDEAKLLDGKEDADKVYVEEVLPKKMEYNLSEIKKYGFWRDIKIMFMTVFAVLGDQLKEEVDWI